MLVSSGPLAAAPQAKNPYDPKSGIDFSKIGPSRDPGVDPVFSSDPAFAKAESYRLVATKPGDHKFPEKTHALAFDVAGRTSLQEALAGARPALSGCQGVAIYLTKGNALRPADLKTAQTFNKPAKDGGLDLPSIETLYLFNLKSMDGGVETATEAMPGTPIKVNMWENGWQGSAFKHLVVDDLEEVKDGTFCQNPFHTIGLRGARTIGVMAFGGHRHSHPPLTAISLPSATLIKAHAFRRNRRVVTANLPKVATIEPYAFDDMTALKYVNAPELKTVGRNAFNDCGALVSVNFPRLEYFHVACFGPNDALTVLRLPSLTKGFDLASMGGVRILYLPAMKTLTPGMVGGNVQALHVPNVERVERDAFAGARSLKKVALPGVARLEAEALNGSALEEAAIRGGQKVRP